MSESTTYEVLCRGCGIRSEAGRTHTTRPTPPSKRCRMCHGEFGVMAVTTTVTWLDPAADPHPVLFEVPA